MRVVHEVDIPYQWVVSGGYLAVRVVHEEISHAGWVFYEGYLAVRVVHVVDIPL